MPCAGEERGTVPLKGKLTEDSVTELLKAEKLPPTIEFNDKNSQKIFNSGVEKQVNRQQIASHLFGKFSLLVGSYFSEWIEQQ